MSLFVKAAQPPPGCGRHKWRDSHGRQLCRRQTPGSAEVFFFPSRTGCSGPARARLGAENNNKKRGAQVRARCQTPPLAPPAGAALPGGGGRGAPGCPTGRGCSHRRRGREAPGGLRWVPGGSGSPGRHPRPGTGRWSRRQPRGSRARVGSAEGLERRKAGDGEEEG